MLNSSITALDGPASIRRSVLPVPCTHLVWMRDVVIGARLAGAHRSPSVDVQGGHPIRRQLFDELAPDSSDEVAFCEVLRDQLLRNPELVQAWQNYSWDKRVSSRPYMDGLTVGFFDGQRQDVDMFGDQVDACVHFIYREALGVIEGRQPR